MSDEYTPTTEEVRRRYHKAARSDIGMPEPQWKTNPEFDRWLASIQEPGEWEYQCRLFPYETYLEPQWITVDHDHNCGGELRRRRIGEWEKVER